MNIRRNSLYNFLPKEAEVPCAGNKCAFLLEDLRTENRTGSGRALAATVSVPTEEFLNTLKDLKTLGRVEADSETGEDTAVKLAT